MFVVPLCPPAASVTFIWQNPEVVDETYVNVNCPFALVVPLVGPVPHAPGTLGV